jgi:hypothetical protein
MSKLYILRSLALAGSALLTTLVACSSPAINNAGAEIRSAEIGRDSTSDGTDSAPAAPAPAKTPVPSTTGTPAPPPRGADASVPTSPPSLPLDGGTCSLVRSGLSFDNAPGGAKCTSCMGAKCCVEVVGCFGGTGDCAALNTCIAACSADSGAGAADAGSGRDGGDAGKTLLLLFADDAGDAGDANVSPCVRACRQSHQASVGSQKAFGECFAKSCGADCK